MEGGEPILFRRGIAKDVEISIDALPKAFRGGWLLPIGRTGIYLKMTP
jgi:hypothetical protein